MTFVSMPLKYIGKFYNACTDPCDTLQGSCACGVGHSQEEWPDSIQLEVFGNVSKKKTILKRVMLKEVVEDNISEELKMIRDQILYLISKVGRLTDRVVMLETQDKLRRKREERINKLLKNPKDPVQKALGKTTYHRPPDYCDIEDCDI